MGGLRIISNRMDVIEGAEAPFFFAVKKITKSVN